MAHDRHIGAHDRHTQIFGAHDRHKMAGVRHIGARERHTQILKAHDRHIRAHDRHSMACERHISEIRAHDRHKMAGVRHDGAVTSLRHCDDRAPSLTSQIRPILGLSVPLCTESVPGLGVRDRPAFSSSTRTARRLFPGSAFGKSYRWSRGWRTRGTYASLNRSTTDSRE